MGSPFPRGPLRLVLWLWLALAAALAVRTALRPEAHTIFPVLAGGAAHWWADEPPYANYRPALDYFRYPPLLAITLTPFDALGLRAGGILWNWCSLTLFAAGLWRFLRAVTPEIAAPGRQAAFLALATAAALRSLWNGQSNTVAVGMLLFGVAALVRGRWWWSALWLAASVQVKLTPLPLVLLLCLLWPRQLPVRIA